MGVIGVIVNCALIGLSGPVHRMFPDMTPAQTVILIIVLEHVMLLLKFLISAAIPDIPHHVEMELARTEYKRREVERLITHQRVAELQVCLLLVYQLRKRLYKNKCPSVSLSAKPCNSLKSSFFIHPQTQNSMSNLTF